MYLVGDALTLLKTLPAQSVHCCVTSPPYWGLRDFGVEGQSGLEKTPEEYVSKLVEVFREVRRVLRDDGTLWINLGDCYASNRKGSGGKIQKTSNNRGSFHSDIKGTFSHGLKEKDLVGIPWRVAFALQADGWYLRQEIIWQKKQAMPESVKTRCTKAHESIFLLSQLPQYYFDYKAIQEPSLYAHEAKYDNGKNGHEGGISHQGQGSSTRKFGQDPTKRNKRSVWTVPMKFFRGHPATFPPDLIEPCILAGCPTDGVVLDPFFGAGTTGLVAKKHGRRFIGIDINPQYMEMARRRIG